ncbi:MAG: acyltransferase [Fibrobacteres bacterium]|nr:acyltransferase [Fibrobacterota bacterium]
MHTSDPRRESGLPPRSDSASEKTPGHSFPAIDGLRALAVVSVVLFHLDARLLPGGFSGVDVFFVISGFVVTASLLRYRQQNFGEFTSKFYARRILRIFPPLIACLLITTALTVAFVPKSWLSESIDSVAKGAFFGIGNISLILSQDGYFSPRTEFNPFVHTWSLGVEEQFYLLCPALIFLWLRWRSASSFKGVVARGCLWLVATISLAISIYQTSTWHAAAFYLLPSRFWELACGALLCLHHLDGKGPVSRNRWHGILGWFGMGLVFLGFFKAHEAGFPFPWSLAPVIGTLLLIHSIAGTTETRGLLQNVLASRPVLWIGVRSYSIYLWHWPIFALLRWTSGLQSVPTMVIGLSLSFLLGDLSYRWIETPSRRRHHLAGDSTKKVLLVGIASISLAWGVSTLLFTFSKHLTLCRTGDVHQWFPRLKISHAQRSSTFEGRTIFVFGDSHGPAYSTALSGISEKGAEVVLICQGGKPVADLLRPVFPRLQENSWWQNGFAKIRSQARPGDVILLASLRMNRLCDQWGPFDASHIESQQNGIQASKDRQEALFEATEVMDSLSTLPISVVMDAPLPILPAPPFRCSDWFNRGNPGCKPGLAISRDSLQKLRAPVMASIRQLTKQFPRLEVWDSFEPLCPGDTFSAFDAQGLPLLIDGDHLSAHGNRVVYPGLENILLRLWSSKPNPTSDTTPSSVRIPI